MRNLVLVGLALALTVPSLAAQTDSMKMKMPGSGCCQGESGMKHPGGMGGMQHGAMMGGMQHGAMMGGMGEMGMGGMMGPMARMRAFDPDHLLAAKDQLSLTEQQTTRLTAIRDAGKKAADGAHQPAHAAMQSLMKEMQAANPDTTKVRQLFMAHETGMANVQWAKASTALQGRAVLTEVQRARVEGWMDGMRGHQRMKMQDDGMPGMHHPDKP
jgi:Spy/CpxP family protein refolding chaperone